ncbi:MULTISPECIES: nitrite reductase large subunit NirB [Asticcacaulis]|uniref:nitrite reductase large subunit NirB n=1 Tax=Asticcacaulis TaxID=76890 RepID=UPI001AE23668|nr:MULTISPECIES: nitrite reductase large subunit NirB [Asticcacaulis]MBP2161240.1 nitrite reductase (NADH) large subunit [Asticcacaulis solisilvae]MDR6802285.1 nitrite reductase (NADH) large subunit [Asticcacaulis sp. BE141]
MTKEKIVVIGAGMAGGRIVEEILKRDDTKFEISIIGAEACATYDRIQLSPVLAGEKTFEQIVTHSQEWYDSNGVKTHFGYWVQSIDRAMKHVVLHDGQTIAYDKLILTLGSDPIRLPLPGADLSGVVAFRDLHDVDAMQKAAEKGGEAVVIGGGLLGLEAAYGLAKRGMKATVIHLVDVLMERQLDEAAGRLLEKALLERGVNSILNAQSEAILGETHVEGLKLKDGRIIPASLLVMAVGIRPHVEPAKAAGLTVERGIVVDDQMRTSDPSIFAVGECVQHRGVCYGLVAPIWDMCRTLADVLTEANVEAAYAGSELATRLKVSGVDLYSAGQFNGGEGCEDIVFRDPGRGVYKRVVIKNDQLVGAVLFGEATDGGWYFDLIKKGESVAEIRDTLIFGQAVTNALAGTDPSSAVAAWPDDTEVCGCNGVSKGQVVASITAGNDTLDKVRGHCKASASCGSCTGIVESLLKCTLGDSFKAQTGPKPMCKCTEHGHAVVRKAIVEQELKTIPDVMQAMKWTTPDGCSSCRPALNYYLLCAWPRAYHDDPRSRFVNERNHANIQKDGTYSVVPRMWGGLTSAKELRAIADVVDKFNVPMVKVTGGQRLDLFGVKKEDLPAVWADLNAAGMVSGHAYAKALRTVKTCVGSEWCRFGTQDSTGLGVKLEQATWGSYMPHKFKMAASGCPRNCAEATIKDFGVVCVDSGYELHVGGNAGIHVRVTDLLTKVATEEEALEWSMAFVQLYREDAWYLERTAPWIERVGLQFVKDGLADPADRAALVARFKESQDVYQVDPWAEHAPKSAPAKVFSPLADLRQGVSQDHLQTQAQEPAE